MTSGRARFRTVSRRPQVGWTDGLRRRECDRCRLVLIQRPGRHAALRAEISRRRRSRRGLRRLDVPALLRESLIASYTLWRWARTVAVGRRVSGLLPERGPSSHHVLTLPHRMVRGLPALRRVGQPAAAVTSTPRTVSNGPDLQVRSIFASLMCDVGTRRPSLCRAPSTAPRVWIYSARVGLTDFDLPRFTTPPSGSLLSTAAPARGAKTHFLRRPAIAAAASSGSGSS